MGRAIVLLFFLAAFISLVACATVETDIDGAIVYNGHTDYSRPDTYGDRVFMEPDGEGGVYVASRGYLARVNSAGSIMWKASGAAIETGVFPTPRSVGGDNRAFVSAYPGPTPGESRVALLQDSDNNQDDCSGSPCDSANWFFDIFDGTTGEHLHRSRISGRIYTDGMWFVKKLVPYFNTDLGDGYGEGWLIVYEHTWCKAHEGGCLQALHVNVVGKQRQLGHYAWSFPQSMVDMKWFAASTRENYYASGVWGKMTILGNPAGTSGASAGMHCSTWLPNVNGFPSFSYYANLVFGHDHVYGIQNAADGSDRWIVAVDYKTCNVAWSSTIDSDDNSIGGVGPIAVSSDRVVITTIPSDRKPLIESFSVADGSNLGTVSITDKTITPHALAVSCGKAFMVSTSPEALYVIDVPNMANACAEAAPCGDHTMYYGQWGKCVTKCSGGYKNEDGQCVLHCPDGHKYAWGWCNPDTGCSEDDEWIQKMNACADPCPIAGERWNADTKTCYPICPYDGPTVYNSNTGACDYRCTLEPLGVQAYNHETNECDWTLSSTIDTALPGNVPIQNANPTTTSLIRLLRGPDGGTIVLYNSRATLVAKDGTTMWTTDIVDFNEGVDDSGNNMAPLATVVDGPESGTSVLVVLRQVDYRTVWDLNRSSLMFTGVDTRTGEMKFRFYRTDYDITINDFGLDVFETGRNTFMYFYYSRIDYSFIRAEEYSLTGTLLRHLQFTLPSSDHYYMGFPFTYSSHGNGMFAILRNYNGKLSVYDIPAPGATDDPNVIQVVPETAQRWGVVLDGFYSIIYHSRESHVRISDTTGNVFVWYKDNDRSSAHASGFVAQAFGFNANDGVKLWSLSDFVDPFFPFGFSTKMDVGAGKVAFADATRRFPGNRASLNIPTDSSVFVSAPGSRPMIGDDSVTVMWSSSISWDNDYVEAVFPVNQENANELEFSFLGARWSTQFVRGRVVVTPIYMDGTEGTSVYKTTGFAFIPGEIYSMSINPSKPVKSLRVQLGYTSSSYGYYNFSAFKLFEVTYREATFAVVLNEDGSRAATALYDTTGLEVNAVQVDCAGITVASARAPQSTGGATLSRMELYSDCPVCSDDQVYSHILGQCTAACGGGMISQGGKCVNACSADEKLNTSTGTCEAVSCESGMRFNNAHNVCERKCNQWETLNGNGDCVENCQTAASYWMPTMARFGNGHYPLCDYHCTIGVWKNHECTLCPTGTVPNTNRDDCRCEDTGLVLVDGVCVPPPCVPGPGIFFESGAEIPYLLDGGFDGQQVAWASTNRWYLSGAGTKLVTEGCRSGNCVELSGSSQLSDAYVAQWGAQVNQVNMRAIAFGGYVKLLELGASDNSVLFNVDIEYESGNWVWGVHTTRPADLTVGEWTKVEGTFTPTEKIKSISFYAMFRNSQGRILIDDTYFSKPEQADKCIECHSSCAECFGADDNQCLSCPNAEGGEFLVDGVCKAPCSSGQYSDGENCVYCPAGTYNPNVGGIGITSCMDCAGGLTSEVGSSSCSSCPPNSSSPDGVKCVDCGNASLSGDKKTCVGMCASGSASANGYEPCSPCSAGTFSTLPGATKCESCPAGMVAAAGGASQCVTCPNGQVTFDGITCEECNDGAVPNQFQNECLCATGLSYSLSAKQCGCPAGTHSNNNYANHLTNGDFESTPVTLGDSSKSRYYPRWYRMHGAEVTDQNCLAGSRCMLLTSDDVTGPDVFAAQWSKKVNQQVAGKTYVFGGWYKAELGADVVDELTILVDIVFTDGQPLWGAAAIYRNSFLKTSLWTKAEVTYTAPAGKLVDAFSMYAIMRKTKGSIIFDNLFFYEPETCSQCAPECATCSGPTASECLSCPSGKYLFSNECVDTCPSGMYADEAAGICGSCHSSCAAECSGPTSGDCATCPAHQIEVEGVCTDKCPAGSFSATGATPCNSCAMGHTSLLGATSCSACPAETVTVDGVSCVSCPEGSTPSPDQNTCSCPNTQAFDGVTCSCPEGLVDENARKDYLVGGTFESDADRWILETGASVVATGCYAGGKCLKVENSGANAIGTYAAQWSVTVNQVTAAPLILELYQKIEAGSNPSSANAVAYLDIVYSDGTVAWGGLSISPTSSRDEWVHSVATIDTGSPIQSFSIYCIIRDTATAYFDNVSVYSPAGTPNCVDSQHILSMPSLSPMTMKVMTSHRRPPVHSPGVHRAESRSTIAPKAASIVVPAVVVAMVAVVAIGALMIVVKPDNTHQVIQKVKRSLSPPRRQKPDSEADPVNVPRTMRQRTRTAERDQRV